MIRSSAIGLLIFMASVSTPLCVAQAGLATANSRLASADPALPDSPSPGTLDPAPGDRNPNPGGDYEGKQTRRILGIVPNFRSVSVDQKLPPLSPRDKLKLSLQDNFDYSSFVYVALLSGISQSERSYPEFHNGVPAYGRYYWHSLADTLDGNFMTEFIVPVASKEDPRYYTLGRGGFFKRAKYAASRLVITRTDDGGATPNLSEIVGNGAAAGISAFYYPSQERTWTKTGQRWVTQVGLDGASNLLKEFWPDVNSKFFHNKY